MNIRIVTYMMVLAIMCSAQLVFAIQLAPPKYSAIDDFGVNLISGQPSTFVPTVGIGGEMGISHSISTHSGQIVIVERGVFGYNDKFGGMARKEQFDGPPHRETFPYVYVMQVHDGEDSAEFWFLRNGQLYDGVGELDSGYSYAAIGDKRHTLKVSGTSNQFLDWQKPDGTIVRFNRGNNPKSGALGYLHQILYPNGFAISVHRSHHTEVESVTTNTGFQLKYVYEKDARGLESSKMSATNDKNLQTVGWDAMHPKKIYAINNAVEYCDPLASVFIPSSPDRCKFVNEWPSAEFFWPGGMPRAFFIGKSEFKIIDAKGGVTKYEVEAFDRDYIEGIQNGKGEKFAPRLTKFTAAGSRSATYNYSYRNVASGPSFGSLTSDYMRWYVTDEWALNFAYGAMGENNYYMNRPDAGGEPLLGGSVRRNEAFENRGVKSAYIYAAGYQPNMSGRLWYVTTRDKRYWFERSLRNFIVEEYHNFPAVTDHITYYEYDERGNLKAIREKPIGAGDHRIQSALYPTTCQNPKTCNQAIWTSDARGNKTHYTYHAESGQILSITYPPNDQGLQAQTRYEYEEKYARIKNSSGSLVQAETPVWMKVREAYCVNSNYSGGSCVGNDEVIIQYEYEHDNLLLTGMTVNADGREKRTCYQYDIYGNRVGEILPNAQLASCSF